MRRSRLARHRRGRGTRRVLGYSQSLFLLLDEAGGRLFTIASHGFDEEGIGSEVKVGKGIIGMAAARATPMRVGNLRQMGKYSRTVVRSFEDDGHVRRPRLRDARCPGSPTPRAGWRCRPWRWASSSGCSASTAATRLPSAAADEAYLGVVATMLANAVEIERAQERAADDDPGAAGRTQTGPGAADADGHAVPSTRVRFFAVDGSTFLDDDYLIKGVAGRILWSLLRSPHTTSGRVEFTNQEVRLDPTLELPEFRDNFESRLILLKRRLDERGAPVRIEKTGRGRFRLLVDTPLRLEAIHPAPPD